MSAFDEKPLLTPATLQEWIGYLEGTPDPGGVRVRLRKKRAAVPGITYDEALDVALCFGWIDGQIKGLDEQYHLQLFTPRRRGSMWSQRNREYIERLTAAGLMREQGLAEVEAAKADGRWDAAYRTKDAPVPPELQAALDANPAAAAFFATLTGVNRWLFIFPILTLKRPESRTRRAAEYAALLEQGRTLG